MGTRLHSLPVLSPSPGGTFLSVEGPLGDGPLLWRAGRSPVSLPETHSAQARFCSGHPAGGFKNLTPQTESLPECLLQVSVLSRVKVGAFERSQKENAVLLVGGGHYFCLYRRPHGILIRYAGGAFSASTPQGHTAP